MENYKNVSYQGLQFGKYHGMFTCLRIDRSNLPPDVYAYDIRESDRSGSLITVEPVVRVNHGGTVLLTVPIKMPKSRDYYTLRDWTFTDDDAKKGEIDRWFDHERGLAMMKKASYFHDRVINSPDKMPYEVTTTPIDEEWKKSISDKWWYGENAKKIIADTPMQRKLLTLREVLLSFGGEEVCMPVIDEDIDNILSRGQVWMGDKVDMKKGRPCSCHANSSALWEANKDKTTIVTGYALSQDGMWRQHSWAIHLKPKQNRVVETTQKRLIYFGFAMTEKECKDFSYWNS